MLDFPQPHLGEMMAHGASGHGDIAPILQFSRYLATGGLSASDDIDGKLLDKLSFHRRSDTVFLLLALTTIYERECPSSSSRRARVAVWMGLTLWP